MKTTCSFFCPYCGRKFYDENLIGNFNSPEEMLNKMEKSDWEEIGDNFYCPDCIIKFFGKKNKN